MAEILTPHLKQLVITLLDTKGMNEWRVCNQFPQDVIRKGIRMGYIKMIRASKTKNIEKVELTPSGQEVAINLLLKENYRTSQNFTEEKVNIIIQTLIENENHKLDQDLVDKFTSILVMRKLVEE